MLDVLWDVMNWNGALTEGLERADAEGLGRAMGAFARQHPLETLAVLAALVVLVTTARRRARVSAAAPATRPR